MDDSSVSSYESTGYDEDEMATYNTDEHIIFIHDLQSNNLRGLEVFLYEPAPSVTNWRNLGQAIGRNTSLEHLDMSMDQLDEGADIATTDNLEAFVRYYAQNRSLKTLIMEEFDFSRARLELIHPFIIENSNLARLELLDCGFSQHDLQLLATAFSQRRNPTSIKYFKIGGNNIDDESVSIITEICSHCPRLQRLDLTYMMRQTIGYQGWTHLATFLEEPSCSLRCLVLDGLNDEGARVLASSLVNNKKLRTLEVFDGVSSSSITSIGWGYFLNVLRSTSNANTTLDSNHSLERLWQSNMRAGCGVLPEDLLFCLKVNEEKDKKNVIRRKIFRYHLNDDEKLSSLIGTDQEILPNLLGWIGKDRNTNTCSTAFYRIIKSYPDLCNFESYDRKMRRQLEVENATIKAELANLKAENEELRQKIEQLTIGK